MLWIDFKLCSYFWFDNQLHRRRKPLFVVNWFQIMFLFLVRQPTGELPQPTHSCELISNYVLIFGSTTKEIYEGDVCKLWIDFKLCSYFWFDNLTGFTTTPRTVVNWFQIMFLFLVRQLAPVTAAMSISCELISNYVLIFGSTTLHLITPNKLVLWIDFKLCSYFWFDNSSPYRRLLVFVVNWFQIMFLFLVRQRLSPHE